MATERLYCAAFGDVANNGGFLALNSPTDADEDVSSPDGTVGFRSGTDQQTGNAQFTLTNLAGTPASVTSITLRVRARIINRLDDSATYTFSIDFGNGAETLTWVAGTDGATYATKTRSCNVTGLDFAEINAGTLILSQSGYSRSMAADGFSLEVDCLDLVVVYESGRIVTCTTEVLTLTDNNAKINSRLVTCATEVLALTDNNATVFKTVGIQGNTVVVKRGKGISYQEHIFDGANYTLNSVANALDGDTGTFVSATFVAEGATFQLARGFSTNIGPIDDITEKPFKVEVSVYVSNTSIVEFYAGYEDSTNLDFSGAGDSGNYPTRGMAYLGESSSVGGAWSNWMPVLVGAFNWDDPHGTNIAEPLTWEQIRDNLTIGFGGANDNTGRVHAIKVRIYSGIDTIRTGYFDGTVTGSFTNPSNANDGSLTTWATSGSEVSNTSLRIEGNTLTQGGASDVIVGVYARARLRATWVSADLAYITSQLNNAADDTDGVPYKDAQTAITNVNKVDNLDYVAIPTSGSPFWGPWYSLNLDSAWWTHASTNRLNWTDLPNCTYEIARGIAFNNFSTEIAVSRMEIAVAAEPTNANRKGGRAKRSRGAVCLTEAVILTSNTATISTPTNLTVTGITEALVSTTNSAAISLTRAVAAITESLTLTENNATVNKAFSLQAATEALQLNIAVAVVNLSHTLVCTTEILTLTEQNANVNAEYPVDSLTEFITLTQNNASVNSARAIAATTEALSLVESASLVSRNIIISTLTETLVLTSNAATVITGENREVTGLTEVLALTTTQAGANLERQVTAVSEILALTANASSINAEKAVIGVTEVLVLTSIQADTPLDKQVASSSEVLTLTASAGLVSRVHEVVSGVQALSLVTFQANVDLDKQVASSTEVLQLLTQTGSIKFSRLVVSNVEELVITDGNAQVFKGADLNVNGATEELLIVEQTASINRSLSLQALSESLVLTENQATVTTNVPVTVVASTEVLVLTNQVAQVSKAKGVTTLTEALIFTANVATISIGTLIQGFTEALTLVQNNASVNQSRVINTTVEELLLTQSTGQVSKSFIVQCLTDGLEIASIPAIVITDRLVLGNTEALQLVSEAAVISTSENLEVTGITEAITLTTNNAFIAFSLSVVAVPQNLVLQEQAALITGSRGVVGLTEGLLFTESTAVILKQLSGVIPGYSMTYLRPTDEYVLLWRE